MKRNIPLGAICFACGVTLATVTAQAARPTQQEHPTPPSAKSAPAHSMDRMHMMMADPAKHKQMMDQMSQCQNMMSMMMEHMKHEGMHKDQPAPKP